ncbi:unnamed protein product [marine sediment metagenome]|uniref:Uncharacterized protein n=1 Tax=marine sediment metagenome TaxID=412755 RepID=X0UMM9_9ZZZZ
MLLIKSIEVEEVNHDVVEIPIWPLIESVQIEKLSILLEPLKIESEIIKGKDYILSNNQVKSIGMTKEVKDIIGAPLMRYEQLIDILHTNNILLEKSNKLVVELKNKIDEFKNMSFIGRLKVLFLGVLI